MSLTAGRTSLPTAEDVDFYHRRGWWISPPLLSDEEIEDARFGAERYYSGERDARLLVETGTDWTEAQGDVLRQNDYVSLQIEELRRLVHNPVIAATAARLARTTEIRLFHDQLIYKPSERSAARAAVGWHTDIAYWRTCSSDNLLTAWIPLQDIEADMGPMLVLDGSHSWAGNDELEFFHDPDLDAVATHIKRGGGSGDVVPLMLKRGQMSFHHCRTIHGSGPNRSGRPRLALAIHLQDDANDFRHAVRADGMPATHINDLLCRRTSEGIPDYRDPDIFPVLWTE